VGSLDRCERAGGSRRVPRAIVKAADDLEPIVNGIDDPPDRSSIALTIQAESSGSLTFVRDTLSSLRR